MTETWRRRILLAAAAWNVLGGASALFDPAQHFAQSYGAALSLEDPLQLFFFRCTWINVIAWGVGYFVAALHAASRLAVLLAGGAGKLVYSAACGSLYLSGVDKPILLAAGVVDVAFALLFGLVLMAERASVSSKGH